MTNVTRLPSSPLTPSEMVSAHAAAIADAESVILIVRDKAGLPSVYWSKQTHEQLYYSAGALAALVNETCFRDKE